MMKSFKMMFFSTMIIGSLITISSNSWMGMWMGLEINLLSIIPLLSDNDSSHSTEASIKYFITQVTASNIILMAIICMFYNNDQIYNNYHLSMMIQLALFIKIGAAPFHSWFPEVMEGLTWNNCLIMLTWQKIAPMIILMSMISQEMLIYLVILMSATIGSIVGFNQISLRKILAYSSINHIGWMIAAMISTTSIWIIYFLIYTIISMNIILVFNLMKIKTISQIAMIFKNNKLSSLFFSMNFLSLGGLPPFMGFLPKWLTIQQLIFMNNYFIAIWLISLTLIAMFFYLRMSIIPMTIMSQMQLTKLSMKINFILYITNTVSLLALASIGFIFYPL
uniref:NADH-ubiquinone oxidoreductase chain 2 n=1 Tax=Cryptocephalus sp. CRY01 TaxID=1205548 RepID=A0A0S2MQP7_9CUCU|nr:NADH deshydrogenase subunit 2 [Cryptocephalus sp. CRY01]